MLIDKTGIDDTVELKVSGKGRTCKGAENGNRSQGLFHLISPKLQESYCKKPSEPVRIGDSRQDTETPDGIGIDDILEKQSQARGF